MNMALRCSLQLRPIRFRRVGAGFVGALKKVQQCCFWRAALTYIVVHKNEFMHLRMIESARRTHGSFGETQRLGRSVGVESRSFDVSSAGPESGADHFVGVGFAGNVICSVTLGCASP